MPNVTIPKFEENSYSEDTSFSDKTLIAISDGAGGCGIFAERWSEWLINKLPRKHFCQFSDFSFWEESIWEEFFEINKVFAASIGGFAQNKFYEEGSFATLAVAWKKRNKIYWITYGDSVVFHYNIKTKKIIHSFTDLSDFSKSPWLINWKTEPNPKGFRCGQFEDCIDSIFL